MRILFVEHKEIFGGGQVVLVNLLREWQRQRAPLEPLVVCPPRAALAARVRAVGVRCETYELGAIEKTRGIAWNLAQRAAPTRRLLQTLRAFQPDAVCANGAYSFLACALAAKIARVPVVWFEHNTTLPNNRLVRGLIGEAQRVVAVSQAIRAQFLSLAPQAQNKIVTIHNGVDPEQFRADPRLACAVKQELGWDEHARVVGTVSRLSPEKNVALFVDAARAVRAILPDVKLLVVGDGPQRAALEARANTDALGKGSVVFVGQREDVARLLNGMDIFVLASDTEGFPIAAAEALACERAVIATQVGGLNELVIDGETGILVPVRDVNALARAELELLRDAAKRRTFGARGRARVIEHFTLAQQARAILDVFQASVERK